MQQSASAYERHKNILDLVKRHQSVRVVDLAEQLRVSESTIRTDLETLDAQGLLVRVRGGAISKQTESNTDLPPLLSGKALNKATEKKGDCPVGGRHGRRW